MSEYEPITQELFEMMDFHHGPYSDEADTVSADYEEFSVACSKINSIHAKLEDENQSLKNIIAKLKHNTTVMELFCKNLENAVKEREDVTLWGVDYIPVPVDADGIPIHIGDVMEWSDGTTFEVIGIGDGTLYYFDDKTKRVEWTSTELKRHVKPDTWERIIEDAREYRLNIGGSYLWKNKSDELVARCKALAGDAE